MFRPRIGHSSAHKNFEQERQCTYKRNIEAHSCNQCRSGKVVFYFLSVSVTLDTQHAKRMYLIVTCGLSGSTYFPDYPTNHMISEKVIEHKMCFNFLHNFYLKHFSL